jgi:hypothetical protein
MALRAAPGALVLGALVVGVAVPAGECLAVRRGDGGGGMDHRAQVCRLRLRG